MALVKWGVSQAPLPFCCSNSPRHDLTQCRVAIPVRITGPAPDWVACPGCSGYAGLCPHAALSCPPLLLRLRLPGALVSGGFWGCLCEPDTGPNAGPRAEENRAKGERPTQKKGTALSGYCCVVVENPGCETVPGRRIPAARNFRVAESQLPQTSGINPAFKPGVLG